MKYKFDNRIIRVIKKMQQGMYWALVLILVAVAGIATMAGSSLPGQVRLFVVRSGSMAPALPTGSLVVVGQKDSYNTNDIITYLTEADANARNANRTVTHRIVDVKDGEIGRSYITKGDVNDVADREAVPASQVLGRVLWHIPYIGYPVSYAKTQMGFVGLIVIPATLIIYSESMSIVRQVKEKALASKRPKRKKKLIKDVTKLVVISVKGK